MRGSRVRPKRSWRALSLLVLAVAGLVAMTLTLVASPARAAALRPHVTTATPSKHVTILALDMSGSMGANDPNGLRCSAANAYIDLSGPGDFIGVVGLDDPNGAHGGPHDFPTAVDWGLAPKEMSTVNARQALRDAIAQKSNNCRPNGSTPTYDALAKAEQMLETATQGGKLSGSVILLTDGDPDPNTDDQIKDIRSELVPQFKSHGWPVDTIALGSDQSFHGFLSDISSATSGSFYDDGHGIVPGVSPLNITPFFLNIFRVRNGRSPGPDIAPTQLDGGTTARNFSVGQYVTHLDIVVVKDSPDAQVSIAAPNGQRFPPAAAGTFVSTDPHYAIFSIDNPQQGAWEVDVHGNGLFLMDSLKVSTLALNITAPNPTVPLALGESFTVTAQLSNQGSAISGGQFSVQGKLTYTGGENGKSFNQDVLLSDSSGSGNYSAKVTVPNTAPSGSYQLAISARAASEDVLTTQVVVRLALFPSAQLISPATGQATTQSVTASVVGWDRILRAIYRWPILSWIGNIPLDGHSADPAASVRGQVLLLGKSYADATVSAVAVRQGTKTSIPVQVVNDGAGAFHLIFPTDASGTYSVTLTTTGAYNIAHGDLTHVARTVLVTITPATKNQEIHAWVITGVYLLLLILLVLIIRALSAPPLNGMLVSTGGEGGEEFARARRGPLFTLLHPAVVLSQQMGLDPGLQFRFHRGGRITVQGSGGRNYLLNGEPVPSHPVSATEAQLTSTDGIAYTVTTGGHGDDDESPAPVGWRQEVAQAVRGGRRYETEDDDLWGSNDDDDDRPRRGLFGRRGSQRADRDDDDDWGSSRSRGSRTTRSSRDDDDDDRPSGRARRQSRRARDDDDDW